MPAACKDACYRVVRCSPVRYSYTVNLGARRLAPKGGMTRTSREPARSSARPARSPPPTRLQPSHPPSRLLPRPQPKHCAPKRHSSFSSSQRSDSPARHPDFSHAQTPSSSCSQEHLTRAPFSTTALPSRARDARSLASPCPYLIAAAVRPPQAPPKPKTFCEAWAQPLWLQRIPHGTILLRAASQHLASPRLCACHDSLPIAQPAPAGPRASPYQRPASPSPRSTPRATPAPLSLSLGLSRRPHRLAELLNSARLTPNSTLCYRCYFTQLRLTRCAL